VESSLRHCIQDVQCRTVRSLPPVRMTWMFVGVRDVMERCDIPTHEKPCMPMRCYVIVSGANDLTDWATPCSVSSSRQCDMAVYCGTLRQGTRCYAVGCLPPVRMTPRNVRSCIAPPGCSGMPPSGQDDIDVRWCTRCHWNAGSSSPPNTGRFAVFARFVAFVVQSPTAEYAVPGNTRPWRCPNTGRFAVFARFVVFVVQIPPRHHSSPSVGERE
jgi:hypothetical protein